MNKEKFIKDLIYIVSWVFALLVLTAIILSLSSCFTGKIQLDGITIQYLEQKDGESLDDFTVRMSMVEAQLEKARHEMMESFLIKPNDPKYKWIGIIIYKEK